MKLSISSLLKLIAGGLLMSLISCTSQKSTFTLVNDSNLARTDEPLTLSREAISEKNGRIPENQKPLLVNANGDTLPSQLDDLDNDGTWDELSFLADIPADTSLDITLNFVDATDYPDFTPRTNVRFGVKDSSGIHNQKKLTLNRDELPVPIYGRFQMDGPAWENDKVGFRHYIDGRNARDLYGKTSSKMALDTVGITPEGDLFDNYHVMEYWGRDILSVGNSLGIGGIGMINEGKPVRLGIKLDDPRNNVDTTKYHLLTEGPVRSIFKLTYKGWHVGDKRYDLDNQVSIWGGHYWYGNKVTLHNTTNTDTLIAGLVNSNNDKPLMVLDSTASDWIGLTTHDKQTYEKEWYLGLSLILPKEKYITYRKAPKDGPNIITSYNALLATTSKDPLNYYMLTGWEMSDKSFSDRDLFREFTQEVISKIQQPVSIQ